MLAVSEAGDVCGLRADGRVSCWSGNPQWAEPDGADDNGYLVALGKKAVSIAGGGADHACAILEDGAVKCWSWQFADEPGLGGSVPDGTFDGRWLEIDLGTHAAPGG
jgi:hypothetical protein